jgi:hypothetical protein
VFDDESRITTKIRTCLSLAGDAKRGEILILENSGLKTRFCVRQNDGDIGIDCTGKKS